MKLPEKYNADTRAFLFGIAYVYERVALAILYKTMGESLTDPAIRAEIVVDTSCRKLLGNPDGEFLILDPIQNMAFLAIRGMLLEVAYSALAYAYSDDEGVDEKITDGVRSDWIAGVCRGMQAMKKSNADMSVIKNAVLLEVVPIVSDWMDWAEERYQTSLKAGEPETPIWWAKP